MSAVGYHPIGGLEDLELGLKRLCRSQLMTVPEFKNMFGAIERHQRDVRLAHLTGTAKDLQDKAVRDTKFYNILVKMLCELPERRSRDQRESLRRVHTWYMTNRHVLFSGPHFGKEYIRDEVKNFLRKATARRHQAHLRTDHEQILSQGVASSQACLISSDNILDPSVPKQKPRPFASPTTGDLDIDQHSASCLSDYEHFFDNGSHAATNSPELDDANLDLQLDPSERTLSPHQDETETVGSDHMSDKPPLTPPPRILLRPKATPVVTFNPLNEQSENLPEFVTTVRNVLHPISSLVNPHAALARMLSNLAPDQLDGRPYVPLRALSAKPTRAESLQAWQTFNKKRSFGQDVISQLNFVGRSGTAGDIRYAAHGHGESPEVSPQHILKQRAPRTNTFIKDTGNEENVFAQQTLQQFYETADIFGSSMKNVSGKVSFTRVRSAPHSRHANSQAVHQLLSSGKKAKHVQNVGLQGEHNWCGQAPATAAPERGTGVNLDTLVDMIDSVSDTMACHKEKLAIAPQLGFRQPSTTGLPSSEEINSVYDSDDLIESVSLTPRGLHQRENSTSRPFSSPLASRTAVVKDDVPNGLKKAKIRCVSAGVVDWRGRIQPEAIRYKWSKTNFGAHTYLKKWYRPNLRSAGKAPGGGRPKTAPITTKERWKTQRPSDRNTRAVQAASHSTTVVDQDDVEAMMQVQHLMSREDRCKSLESLVDFDNAMWKKHARNTMELPVTEYLSFVAPSVTTIVEPKSPKSTHNSGKVDEKSNADGVRSSEYLDHLREGDARVNVPHSHYNEEALNAVLQEEYKGQTGSLQSSSTEIHEKGDQKENCFQDSQLYPLQLCMDCRDDRMAARVQRSAGRMPGHSHSTSAQMQTSSHPHSAALRRATPLRTPASIPTPHTTSWNSRSGPVLLELEYHARKTKNPTEFMKKVEGLRSMEGSQHSILTADVSDDSYIRSSLQICKLPVPSRRLSLQVFTEYNHLPTKQGTAASVRHNQSEDMMFHRETPITSSVSILIGGRGSTDAQATPSVRSISKIGRPIPQVTSTPDPDQVFQSVQMKKEASAAVDIQRIFRGYVARGVYKSLLSEERRKREEVRRAALRIQRMYRSHLARKLGIKNRPHLNPDLVQWSKDVKEIQSDNAVKRQAKLENWTNEINSNQKDARTKLAVIGPHVEVYSAYHPKKTGLSKQELHMAAVKIQKIVRGWLLRTKMKKLAKKAIWHGSNFNKLATEYKAMLTRVQQRHGVEKPRVPFTVKDFNVYMDLRRRYESIFEKRSFGGELEQGALEAFFQECDLFPSRAEIDEAVDVTQQGRANKRENQGVTKKELLDIIFYIYVPVATGLRETRRSTWMNPIVDGKEARKLLGSKFVEPTPLAPCIKLVMEAKKVQRQREQAAIDAGERNTFERAAKTVPEDKQTVKKSKKVAFQTPQTEDA